MLKTLDHIKVFEDGTLLVVFLDGTEIECKNEEGVRKDADWGLRFLIGFFSCSFADGKIAGNMVKYS